MKRVISEKKEIPVNDIGEIKLTVMIAGKLFTMEPTENNYLLGEEKRQAIRDLELALIVYADKLGFRLTDEI